MSVANHLTIMFTSKQALFLVLLIGLFVVGVATAVFNFNQHLTPYPHLRALRRPVYSSFILDTDSWISYSHASFGTGDSPTAVLGWFRQAGWQIEENNASRMVAFFDLIQVQRQVVVLTGPGRSTLVGVHTAVTFDIGIPLLQE